MMPGGGAVRRGTEPITPRSPAPLAGYASRGNAPAVGVHVELEATLVAWSGSGSHVAWLSIDAIAVTATLRDRLVAVVREALDNPSLTVLVCASHTHAAPRGWTGSIHPGTREPPDEPMVDELLGRVDVLARRVAGAAATQVVPRWICDPVVGVGANRHRPAGPHDPTTGVLALVAAESGTVEALIVDHASHPTVLPATNLWWSADWPGAARSVIRAALRTTGEIAGTPTEPSIVFLQGAAGDVSARFIRRSADFAEVARLGTVFGGATASLSQRAVDVTGRGLRVRRKHIELRTRDLPDRVSARTLVERCAQDRAAADPDPNDPQTRRLQTRLEGAQVQLNLATAAIPKTVELPISIVSLDQIVWVHVPLELFASLGLGIKAASPYAETRVVGYTDGYYGYLADRQAHRDGTYEALSSLFDADQSEAFVSRVITELHKAHADDH